DAIDPQRLETRKVIGRHPLGQLLDRRPLLLRLDDQLVVNVRDVDDPYDLVAEVNQVTFDCIEDDRPDHVADMAGRIDGRPADVHPHASRNDCLERLFGLGQRVIDSQWHWWLWSEQVRYNSRQTAARSGSTQQGSTRTTASHAMASARPTGPTCSPVLALTLT